MNLALTSIHGFKKENATVRTAYGIADMDGREDLRKAIQQAFGFDCVWFGDEELPEVVIDAYIQHQFRN